MAKVDLDLVKFVLKRNKVDDQLVSRIVNEIQTEVSSTEEELEKKPPIKKQFVILLSDPNAELENDMVGWVMQIPEDEHPQEAVEKIKKAAKSFNTSKKGKRFPVKSVGEACEVVSASICKEQKLWVKTKEPVLIVKTDNELE